MLSCYFISIMFVSFFIIISFLGHFYNHWLFQCMIPFPWMVFMFLCQGHWSYHATRNHLCCHFHSSLKIWITFHLLAKQTVTIVKPVEQSWQNVIIWRKPTVRVHRDLDSIQLALIWYTNLKSGNELSWENVIKVGQLISTHKTISLFL